MIKAYFISDVHLRASDSITEKNRQKKVVDFLKSLMKHSTHLYLVGDIFDFWFEYKYVVPKNFFNILYHLKALSETGTKIVYLAGNHDFALGHYFRQYLDIQTFDDSYNFELGGKKFHLYHGDGIARKDRGYRFLKKVLRNKLNQKLFRFLHPDFGIPFAKFVSGSSRKYTNNVSLKDESDYIKYAEKKFKEQFDYVLMGHRHHPLEHTFKGHKYINLGDWLVNNSYAYFDGKNLSLKFYTD
jgi:UDP-2,3-diacylglucosamine hydrolase